MSYSVRDQDRIHRMAKRCGIADIYDFAKQTMGDSYWENFNAAKKRDFEAAMERHAAPAAAAPTQFDRTANHVADAIGLPAPKATGRCHYCGQPLNRRGHCEECV